MSSKTIPNKQVCCPSVADAVSSCCWCCYRPDWHRQSTTAAAIRTIGEDDQRTWTGNSQLGPPLATTEEIRERREEGVAFECYFRYIDLIKYATWTLLLLVLLLVTGWQVSMLVSNFFSEPHYISSSFFEFDTDSIFPNVTVCNFNRVNRTLAEELNVDNFVIEHLFFSQVATYELSSYQHEERQRNQSKAWQRFKSRNISENLKDVGKLLRHLGHSCEKTMRVCFFADEQFNCCANAVSVLSGEYGACWVINPPVFTKGDTYPKQPWRGVSGGLRALIDVSLEDYVQDVVINNYAENGILVAPNFNPYEAYYPEVVAIGPGSHSRIAMSKRKRSSKKPVYESFPRFCIDDGVLEYVPGKYDFTTCEDDCNQMAIVNACGCAQMQEMPAKYKEVPTCDGDQVINCIDSVASKTWLDTKVASKMRDCMNKCRPTCNQMIDIFTVTSTTAWPAEQFKTALPKWLKEAFGIEFSAGEQGAKKLNELILLDLFYPSTYYTMVEETEKISLFALIGNVGGILGIWLGVSVITTVRLLSRFCSSWVWSYFKSQQTDEEYDIEPNVTSVVITAPEDPIVGGGGSHPSLTRDYQQFIGDFLRQHRIRTVLDVPCGLWSFSQLIDWGSVTKYIGLDIVASVVEYNRVHFANDRFSFGVGSLTSAELPPADLLICKDVLHHLPLEAVALFLKHSLAKRTFYGCTVFMRGMCLLFSQRHAKYKAELSRQFAREEPDVYPSTYTLNRSASPESELDRRMTKGFNHVYDKGLWGAFKGVAFSGGGSHPSLTRDYQQFIGDFLRQHRIRTVLDVPCGLWSFSQLIDWGSVTKYIGLDIVASVVEYNRLHYANDRFSFGVGSLTSAELPPADLLICKDVLQHLPLEAGSLFLNHSLAMRTLPSGERLCKYRYLLVTNDKAMVRNADIAPAKGAGRDMTLPPFSKRASTVFVFRKFRDKITQLLDLSDPFYGCTVFMSEQ